MHQSTFLSELFHLFLVVSRAVPCYNGKDHVVGKINRKGSNESNEIMIDAEQFSYALLTRKKK